MMKKLTIIALVCAAFSVSTHAAFEQHAQKRDGFYGPSQGVTTVSAVNRAGIFDDDKPVTLTGYIKESLGDEKYLFFDSTGSVIVEIDNDKWYGIHAKPDTKLTIFGEIDRDFTKISVDVDRLQLAE